MRKNGSCDDLAEVVGNPDRGLNDEIFTHETEGLGDEAADFSRHLHE